MVKLEKVSKYYVGKNDVALGLSKVSLELEIGEMVVITGESGSGKSTLLNVISGSDTYEDGEMNINGNPTSYFDEDDWEEYRRDYIGFVYQSYQLIENYTVFENVNVALVIKGDTDGNKDKVNHYLEQVGLLDLANKKAAQLSSGQKQRLAIARALAKETPILVADEPTGNLDSENSIQIMKILSKLSKDRLIIIVTHDYELVREYATRKIRMFDGEVIEDIILDKRDISKTEPIIKKKEQSKKEQRAAVKKIISLNRRSRPVLTTLLMLFMIMVLTAFFIFLGGFIMNLDNSTSKIFDEKYFTNGDLTRIVIRNYDGSALGMDDVEKLRQVKRVESVELYDGAVDAYYLVEENKDFAFVHKVREDEYTFPSHIIPQKLRKGEFIKSETCILEEDLKIGTLPEKLYDIVLYTDDESLLGKQIMLYIGKSKWHTQLAQVKCRVVGLLKESTTQIYFSKEFAAMLSINPQDILQQLLDGHKDELKNLTITKYLSVRFTGHTPEYNQIPPKEGSGIYVDEEEVSPLLLNYPTADLPIFIINEELTGNQVRLSNEAVNVTYGGYPTDSSGTKIMPLKLGSTLKLAIDNSEARKEWQESQQYEEYNRRDILYIMMNAVTDMTLSSRRVIEVSREMYDEIVFDKETHQMAVFINDYAYTEDVLNAVKELGYEAASVYRVGATEYDFDLINRKAVSMGISMGGIIMIFVIGVFVIGLIMNLSIRGFRIFRLLGLNREMLGKINTVDILSSILFSVVVSMIIIMLLNVFGFVYVVNVVKYYKIRHYLMYILLVAGFTITLVKRRKKRLKNILK